MEKLNFDCLNLIFKELTDKNFLHSCLLVNKKWCNIVVPILWKGYSWYGSNCGSRKKLFNVILSCLSSSWPIKSLKTRFDIFRRRVSSPWASPSHIISCKRLILSYCLKLQENLPRRNFLFLCTQHFSLLPGFDLDAVGRFVADKLSGVERVAAWSSFGRRPKA